MLLISVPDSLFRLCPPQHSRMGNLLKAYLLLIINNKLLLVKFIEKAERRELPPSMGQELLLIICPASCLGNAACWPALPPSRGTFCPSHLSQTVNLEFPALFFNAPASPLDFSWGPGLTRTREWKRMAILSWRLRLCQ